jgi:hypothetical protein
MAKRKHTKQVITEVNERTEGMALARGIKVGDLCYLDGSMVGVYSSPGVAPVTEIGYLGEDEPFQLADYKSDPDNSDYCYVGVIPSDLASCPSGWMRVPTEFFDFYTVKKVKVKKPKTTKQNTRIQQETTLTEPTNTTALYKKDNLEQLFSDYLTKDSADT